MAKKDEERDDAHRQIIPVVDSLLLLWLESLFYLAPKDAQPGKVKSEPDSFPERIMLRPWLDKKGLSVGPSMKQKEWKPTKSEVPTREQLVQIANEFVGAAQQKCNVQQRQQTFGLYAYSNLKGPDSYEQYSFTLDPKMKEYGEKGGPAVPASDDEDTHRDRLLSTSLQHARWQQEQFAEAMGGIVKALLKDKNEQRAEIQMLYAERRQLILAQEEALDRSSERKIKEARAEMINGILGDAAKTVRGLLPGVVSYMTKGKVGIAEGLRQFIDELTEQKKIALFGIWKDGARVKPGILSEEQMKLLAGIAEGSVEATRISDFTMSLTPEQLGRASEVLSGAEIQALLVLSKSADKANEASGAAESGSAP
jgi:hypothetical protein